MLKILQKVIALRISNFTRAELFHKKESPLFIIVPQPWYLTATVPA